MSLKAPNRLGGTDENTEERFHLEEIDNNITNEKEFIIPDLTEDERQVTEIESLCMNCNDNGITKLLLTKIPYFKEIILMSFECEHCGFKNNEVQFGGKIQEKGIKITLKVTCNEDLNRQLIKSDTATINIPEIDFEIPPKTQRGVISTIEGILHNCIDAIRKDQEERRKIDPETTIKIDDFLTKITLMAAGINLPFTVIIIDPAGNSYIENPMAPQNDANLVIDYFYRSEKDNLDCGLQPDDYSNKTDHVVPNNVPKRLPPRNEGLDTLVDNGINSNFAKKEAIKFQTNCHSCNVPGETLMCITDIPHFREVIIMSFNCESCGFKTNEVKGGGSIPDKGEIITLKVDDKEMLNCDILKSDSASVIIPEIELELQGGSLGGLYTTIEGLLDKIKNNITEGNPFAIGDSSKFNQDNEDRNKLNVFVNKLHLMAKGELLPFTIILQDPLANSFIFSPFFHDENGQTKDPNLTSELYNRSEYENEELGLLDMNVDNYNNDTSKKINEISKHIESDKKMMKGGGKAIKPSDYHPNPKAVMNID